MRSSAVVVVVVVVGYLGASAGATPRGVSWADLVGDYRGPLAWKNCNTPGTKQASIALDAIDGALAVDLTAAGGGLRALSLAPDAPAVWSGQQGDVTVRISRPRANTLALAVTIDESCEVRGTLRRSTIAIDACDRVLAWSRIEQKCTKYTGPRIEDAKALDLEQAVWKKLTAAQRTKASATCAPRAEALATAMIDAGCAPVDDPQLLQLGAACQRLVEVGSKIARCSVATPMLHDLARDITATAMPGTDTASRRIAEHTCAEGQRMLEALAQRERCPL